MARRSTRLDRRQFLTGAGALLGATLLPCSRARALVPPGLEFASAGAAARAIRRGEVSSLELTTLMLERIRQHNPGLNAVVTVAAESALERAKAADEASGRGESWGPLHGVPCTVKDTIETAQLRTTAGSPGLASYIPSQDADVVSRLRATGAVLLGKTNVPVFAGDLQSYNPVFGVSNNPWDRRRTPGGSTGGGAAAVAAGFTYLELGSDLDGSIRTPAHFCGIYGHKPTLGVVPMRGHIPPSPGTPTAPPALAVAGPLARNAADLKLALEALGGPDEFAARAYRWSLAPARGTRLSEYRLGFVLDHPSCPVSSDVAEVLGQVVDALRKAGVSLHEGWPPGVIPPEQYDTYLFLLNSTVSAPLRGERLEEMRRRAARQDGSYEAKQALAWTAPHRHYAAANDARIMTRGLWREWFRTYDAFLMPTAFVPAFPHDHSPSFLARRLATPQGAREYFDLLFWTSFASLAGLPATTAPVGRTRDGLPVGIQIVGPYLEDATPIDVAGRLADVVGGFTPPNGY